MMIVTSEVQAKRTRDHRAARLWMMRQQLLQHIKRTDVSAHRVEQALDRLIEANAHSAAAGMCWDLPAT
ncbi:hypothetical protein GA829_19265 [Mesorhizobium sp. INR15]|nr:hypothetical protein GA829_19265 [Mesorhizobium sp. INR15]